MLIGGGGTCRLFHDKPEYCGGTPLSAGGGTFGTLVLLKFQYFLFYQNKKKIKFFITCLEEDQQHLVLWKILKFLYK